MHEMVSLMSFRRTLTLASLAVPLLALAACEVPSPAQRRLLDSMIGRSPVDVVRTFGVPTRTYAADGHTFLAYVEQQGNYVPDGPIGPGPGWGWGWGGYGWGGGWGGGWGPGWGGWGGSYYTSSCQTLFEVVGDKVSSWSMKGDGC